MGYIYNNKSSFSTFSPRSCLMSFPPIISESLGCGKLMSSPILGSLLPVPHSVLRTDVSAQVSTTQSRASLVLHPVPTRGHCLPAHPPPAFALGGNGTHKSYTSAPPCGTSVVIILYAPCIGPSSLTVTPTAALLEGNSLSVPFGPSPKHGPKQCPRGVPDTGCVRAVLSFFLAAPPLGLWREHLRGGLHCTQTTPASGLWDIVLGLNLCACISSSFQGGSNSP